MKVEGWAEVISATLTRPANTTQYGAGEQVADSATAPTPITFSNVGRHEDGTGVIIGAICIDSAAQATKPNLRLYLFDSSPTPNNDNAAWAPSDADMNALLGYVEFTAWEVGTATAGAAGNCASIVKNLDIVYRCAAGTRDIYGLLVERGTYTPVSAEAFKIRLRVLQN